MTSKKGTKKRGKGKLRSKPTHPRGIMSILPEYWGARTMVPREGRTAVRIRGGGDKVAKTSLRE